MIVLSLVLRGGKLSCNSRKDVILRSKTLVAEAVLCQYDSLASIQECTILIPLYSMNVYVYKKKKLISIDLISL